MELPVCGIRLCAIALAMRTWTYPSYVMSTNLRLYIGVLTA